MYPGHKDQVLTLTVHTLFNPAALQKDLVLMPESSEHGQCWFPLATGCGKGKA